MKSIFDLLRTRGRSGKISKGESGSKESYIKEITAYSTEEYVEPLYESLTYSQIEALYENSSLLKRYVRIIINGCLRYKLRAIPKEGYENNQRSLERAKQINDLFEVCNEKLETFNEVREQYLKDLLLYGRAGIEIEPTKGKEVKALYAVPGYIIRLNVDPTGMFKDKDKAYMLLDPNNLDQVVSVLPYDSLVYFVYDKISDRVYGDVPLDCIKTELITDIRSAKNVEVGVINLKSGVLCLPKSPRSLLKDVTTRLIQLLRGNARAKIVSVNTEDAKFIDLTNLDPKDNVEIQKWLAKKANIYNIPSFSLGLEERTSSLNAREQKDEFRTLIESFVDYEVEKLNAVLIRTKLGYDDIKIVCPDFASREEYERSRIAVRLVNGRIITPNEARERYLGLPRLDDPEADKLQTASRRKRSQTDVEEEQVREQREEAKDTKQVEQQQQELTHEEQQSTENLEPPKDVYKDVLEDVIKIQEAELLEKKRKLIDHLLNQVEEEDTNDEDI